MSYLHEKLLLNGFYKKRILIPNGILANYVISHHKRRYRCFKCNKSYSKNDPISIKGHSMSLVLEMKIMDLLISPKMTFREVSRMLGVLLFPKLFSYKLMYSNQIK